METIKTPQLYPMKQSVSYKMIIPSKVEEIIRYTCNKVWNTEWSGVLFYTIEGSIKNKDLTVICKDIFIMNVGSTGYTEFSMSPDVINYMTENPELLESNVYQGLIHSHHSMNTFFSSTDLTTLYDEGKDSFHFVSLIVNNSGEYSAAITRNVTKKQQIIEDIVYSSFEEKEIKESLVQDKTISEIQYFPLEITIEGGKMSGLHSRIEELKRFKYSSPIFPSMEKTYKEDFSYTKPIQGSFNFKDSKSVKELQNISTTKDKIKSLAIQILTGSITLSSNSKINIEEWVKKSMTTIYEKRFGKDDSMFTAWIETLLEYIFYYDDDIEEDTCSIKEDEHISIMAERLHSYISKLPSNKYIDVILNTLLNYIV